LTDRPWPKPFIENHDHDERFERRSEMLFNKICECVVVHDGPHTKHTLRKYKNVTDLDHAPPASHKKPPGTRANRIERLLLIWV
jgi:hypothetical protein